MCLVSEMGAGARYMSMFDELHHTVRHRLCNCEQNWCIACLATFVTQDLQRSPSDPHAWMIAIDHFEKGIFYDTGRREVQSTRRYYEEASLRGPYGIPADPVAPLYDSFRRSPRDYDYPTGGSLQQRLERGPMYDERYDARKYATQPSFMNIDWIAK